MLEKFIVGLSAIAGGLIGFKVGGVKGAIIGALIGTGVGLLIDTIVFDNDGKISGKELLHSVRDALIIGTGTAVGFAFGGIKGGLLGLSLGVSLTLLLEAVETQGNIDVAHSLENLLVTLIPVGLGATLGKKFLNTFLIGFDDAFITGVYGGHV